MFKSDESTTSHSHQEDDHESQAKKMNTSKEHETAEEQDKESFIQTFHMFVT